MSSTQMPTALFQGFDSFIGQGKDTALSGTSSTPTSLSDGTVVSEVSICTTTDSVSKALSISASASYSSLDASVSDKASFVQSLNMTSTSVVVVVHTYIQVSQSVVSYALASGVTAPDANASPTSQDTIQAFFQAYGDSYVSAMTIGGEYYAAFVYESTSVETQTAITNDLSASVGTVNANLSATISNTAESTTTSVQASQQLIGSTSTLPDVDDVDAIISFASSFSASMINAPELLSFSTAGYESVPGITTTWNNVAANRKLMSAQSSSDWPWVDVGTTLDSLYTACQTIATMYANYSYTADTTFATNSVLIQTDYDAFNSLLAGVEADVNTVQPAPSPYQSLSLGTPLVTYTINPALVASNEITTYDLTAAQIAGGVGPSRINIHSDGFTIEYSDGTSATRTSTTKVLSTLSLVTGETISLLGLPVPVESYQIGELQTTKGQTYNSGDTNLAYVKSPPQMIGFMSVDMPGPTSTASPSITLSPIEITLSPVVWAISSS